jgi:hypothetical protein
MIGMRRVAIKTKVIWRKGILSKSFGLTPNAPATIKRKKGSTPLVDQKDMVNSIQVEDQHGEFFVGINRQAKGKGNQKLHNLAAIHEYGRIIKSGRSGGSTIILPPRPHREKTAIAVEGIYEKTVVDPIKNALTKF